MNIIVLTAVRLFGDGLGACLGARRDMNVLAVVNDLDSLRDQLSRTQPDVVLVDVTQGINLFDVRSIAAQWPNTALVALGLQEQCRNACGREEWESNQRPEHRELP